MLSLRRLPALTLVMLTACSGDSDPGGDPTDGGGSGAADSGGEGEPIVCPDDVPQDGSACESAGQSCTYLRCLAEGEVTARCTTDDTLVWEVSTVACGSLACGDDVCEPGQVCYASGAGFLLYECVDTTCGDGPVDCACAAPTCGACWVAGSQVGCNTCSPEESPCG